MTDSVNTNTEDIATLNSNLPLCGFAKWDDISISNASFIGTGSTASGVTPKGNSFTNVYNLGEITRGRWLCIFHAKFKEGTNTTGLRGLRVYVNDTSTGNETFIAPSGNGTDMRTFYIIDNATDSDYRVRMGLYQSTGAAVTASEIWLIAIKIGNL